MAHARWTSAAVWILAVFGGLGWSVGLVARAEAARPDSTSAPSSTQAPAVTGRSVPAEPALTAILVVRHAEKNTAMLGADPPLSAAGMLRTRDLGRMLARAGLTAVYTTPYLRNRQTADPVAREHGLVPKVIHDTDSTLAAIRAEPPGSKVLVVGHSNTLPQIIDGLTGTPIEPFTEGEFDRLYVVTLDPQGRSSLMLLRFGAPTPPKP
jgi:broad specificity phosphatase PhoE